MQSLQATGRQSQINCTRVAATPITCKLYLHGCQLPATRIKSTEIFIQLAMAMASPHPRRMIPTIQLTALGYLIWKMCSQYGWHGNTEANFSHTSGKLGAKPPVFSSMLGEQLF
jgi:hypothetical protein